MDCFSVTNILHISQEEMEAPLQFSSIETGSYLQELLLSREVLQILLKNTGTSWEGRLLISEDHGKT